MTRLRVALGGLLVLFLALSAVPISGRAPDAPAGPKVTVRPVSYAEVGKTVRALKGKVVVVDFWGNWCIPCKQEMPHLVKLHQKYAKDGFAAITVLTPSNKEKQAEALAEGQKFLQEQGAAFDNLYLDVPPRDWKDRLPVIKSLPSVFLFNRDNQLVKKWPVLDAKGETVQDPSYEEVEKVLVGLLKK
jgi:thiol-disulfide isomerase/thioredoxin